MDGAVTESIVTSSNRVRDAALLAKGYVTLRVTWRQMVATPRAVARRIAATLAKWSPEVLDSAPKSGLFGDLGAKPGL